MDIAILLLVLGIVPGLLYIGLYRGTQTITISVNPSEHGCTVYLGGDDQRAIYDLGNWIERNLK